MFHYLGSKKKPTCRNLVRSKLRGLMSLPATVITYTSTIEIAALMIKSKYNTDTEREEAWTSWLQNLLSESRDIESLDYADLN